MIKREFVDAFIDKFVVIYNRCNELHTTEARRECLAQALKKLNWSEGQEVR